MHRLSKYLFITVIVTPNVALCQAHHMSGHGHAHFSHSHGGSHAWHSHPHYHYRYYGGSGYGGRSKNYYGDSGGGLSNPLKGIHDFSAGGGAETGQQVLDKNVTGAAPAFFINYNYFFSRGVSVGISAGTQVIWGNDTCHCSIPASQGNMSYQYDFRITTFTVAANLSWLLYSENNFQAYEGISGGIMHYVETDIYSDKTTSSGTGYRFNGQVTLIGFRYGKALGGFVELGFGYKGVISGGISYQAGYKKTHGYN